MESREDPYAVPIEELCVTVRCYCALKRDGVDTVGQLAMLPERHLMGLRNFTPETMDELKFKLKQLGLSPWVALPPTGNQARQRYRWPAAGTRTAGQAVAVRSERGWGTAARRGTGSLGGGVGRRAPRAQLPEGQGNVHRVVAARWRAEARRDATPRMAGREASMARLLKSLTAA